MSRKLKKALRENQFAADSAFNYWMFGDDMASITGNPYRFWASINGRACTAWNMAVTLRR